MFTNPDNGNVIPVIIVAGMSLQDHAIGNNNELLWHIPDDMKRFKALTFGHPIIMGRKTFESIITILGKPLPGRTNIVITRNRNYNPRGAYVATSLEDALTFASTENPTEIHIGGGAELYRQALPLVDKLYLTYFDDVKAGDVFFPPFETDFIISERHGKRTHMETVYEWVDYVRKTNTAL